MKGRELRFEGFESLRRWLETTKWGADVMREVLYGKHGQRFVAEQIERAVSTLPDDELPTRPTYVVVELHGDGFVKVYGERHVRVQIIQRPLTTSSDLARAANLLDELMAADLRYPFRDVYYPTACRAQEMWERQTVRQRFEREQRRAFGLAVIEACNKIGGGK